MTKCGTWAVKKKCDCHEKKKFSSSRINNSRDSRSWKVNNMFEFTIYIDIDQGEVEKNVCRGIGESNSFFLIIFIFLLAFLLLAHNFDTSDITRCMHHIRKGVRIHLIILLRHLLDLHFWDVQRLCWTLDDVESLYPLKFLDFSALAVHAFALIHKSGTFFSRGIISKVVTSCLLIFNPINREEF